MQFLPPSGTFFCGRNYYRKLQLMKMQRTTDLVVSSPKWSICNMMLIWKARELCRTGHGKSVKTEGTNMSVESPCFPHRQEYQLTCFYKWGKCHKSPTQNKCCRQLMIAVREKSVFPGNESLSWLLYIMIARARGDGCLQGNSVFQTLEYSCKYKLTQTVALCMRPLKGQVRWGSQHWQRELGVDFTFKQEAICGW